MGVFQDLTGQHYGLLTVESLAEKINGKIKWNCRCDCGNHTVVAGSNLKNGHTTSCGCTKHNSPGNMIDLTGKRFGKLVVKSKGEGRFTSGGAYKATWICDCDCGKHDIEVDGEKLRKGHTQSCGCLLAEHIKSVNYSDLVGQRFGRLTVIRYLDESERTAKGYNWWCRCDCGNEIKANATKLKTGLQQSCGCLKEEMKPRLGEMSRKYQNSNKRLYSVYRGMISRCYDTKHREYKNYGGRGITICDEWSGELGYDAFAQWALSSGYNDKAEYGECTIDRIDVDKGYEPGNCRWITNKEQQNNRRDNVRIEYNGESRTITEWAEMLGVSANMVKNHCIKHHESIGDLQKMLSQKA